MLRFFLIFICFSAFLASDLIARDATLSRNRLQEMETSNFDQELKRILDDYYLDSFGGLEVWSKLQSLQTTGEIIINDFKIPFIGYKKKPNLCKIIFNPLSENRYIQAFDGQDAWEWNTHVRAAPNLMTENNARSFITSSSMGDQLLFPQLNGKKIVFIGSRLLENGQLVRDIQVTLPKEVSITYSIGVGQSILLEETHYYSEDNRVERMVYSDHRIFDGVKVAFCNDVYLNEKLSHSIRLRQVQFNPGLTAWMFSMPSELDSLISSNSTGLTRFQFKLESESLLLGNGLSDELKLIPTNSILDYSDLTDYFKVLRVIQSESKTDTLEN